MEKALAAAYNRNILRQTPTRRPPTIYDAEIVGFLDQHYSSSLIPRREDFIIYCLTASCKRLSQRKLRRVKLTEN